MYEKFVTKRNVLMVTIFAIVLMELLARSLEIGFCGTRDYGCASVYDGMAATLLIFVPVLFFSLLTYFVRNEIFGGWMKFAVWWVPLTVVLALLLPNNDQSQSIGMGSTQGLFVIVMTLIFIIVSLIIIVAKYMAMKKKNSTAK